MVEGSCRLSVDEWCGALSGCRESGAMVDCENQWSMRRLRLPRACGGVNLALPVPDWRWIGQRGYPNTDTTQEQSLAPRMGRRNSLPSPIHGMGVQPAVNPGEALSFAGVSCFLITLLSRANNSDNRALPGAPKVCSRPVVFVGPAICRCFPCAKKPFSHPIRIPL